MLRKIFPFLGWFEGYNLAALRADLVAGVTVALVLIPQSMAYAQLAGLPPYYGLYAAFLPPLVAAAFGSSRQLATGPVAVVSLMTATALEPLATAGSEAYVAYAMLLALLVGVFQFSLGLFRLGILVNFLSHPVVNGFTNAAALIIASSQLSKFFGVSVDKADHHYETIWNVLLAAKDYTHWTTFGFGIMAIIVMWGLKRVNPRIPNVLVAVVVATLLSWLIGLERTHVASVADIESPAVRSHIQEFNHLIKRIDSVSQIRVRVSADDGAGEAYTGRMEVCRSCHTSLEAGPSAGELSAVPIHRRHDVDLLNFELEEFKHQAGVIREELRGDLFCAIPSDNGQTVFCLKEDMPEGRRSDGRIWRLKVGTGLLDLDALKLTGGGAVVGTIPQGLPNIKVPKIDSSAILSLMAMAVTISLLGFMEAISIAKAMAAKTSQRLDYNQELMGQGLANIVGSFGQSYPASGSFSRSAVNLQAGAQTGLSSVFSSAVVVITLLFFTPVLYHLPQSVLAAIIMMAVIGLVNVRGFVHAWEAQRLDGAISIITFVCTLGFAPHLDRGIMIGLLLSLALYLARKMKPKVVLLSKHPDSTFRDLHRFGLAQCRYIAVVRFPSPLFFANVGYLEETILERVSAMPDLRHILIVGNGINELDASGEELLSRLVAQMREAGHDVSFSGLNDSVLGTMRRTGLYDLIGEDHLFRNATMAVAAIHGPAHVHSEEKECPLQKVVLAEGATAPRTGRPTPDA